jgi:hypothetical protein
MLLAYICGEERMSVPMLGAVPGTLVVVGVVVLGVVLLAYAVYFFFFKKM